MPAMAAAIVSRSLTRETGMGFGVLIMAMGGITLADGIIPIVGADGVKCDVVPASSGFHLGGGGGGHSPPLGISLPPLGIFTFPIIQYCEMK